VKLPPWLFDWIADMSTDVDEAVATARAWAEAIDGTRAPFDMARYRELRRRGAPGVPFDQTVHSGFWRRTIG
jgi:hypothetical protein